jgi:hypothetical protein
LTAQPTQKEQLSAVLEGLATLTSVVSQSHQAMQDAVAARGKSSPAAPANPFHPVIRPRHVDWDKGYGAGFAYVIVKTDDGGNEKPGSRMFIRDQAELQALINSGLDLLVTG